ncbi:MAG TPA: hypothetical protein VFM48_05325 [Aquabacterium sp.]|nr:hypothetical protein [Aquabacterium sp.]
MASRILALIIWATVAASVAFWGLRWLARPAAVPANASAVSLDNAGRGDPHRLLVGPAKASGPAVDMGQNAMLAGRIKLIGVVAPKNPEDKGGVALVSIDGKPPRALHIGDIVDGDNVIRKLTQRNAEIGPASGPTVVSLDLPGLPPPATGTLPPVDGLSTTPPAGDTSPAPAPAGSGMTPMPGGLPVVNDNRHQPRDLPRGPVTN